MVDIGLNEFVPQQAVFTVAEFADVLRIGLSSAYGIVREGRIKHIRIGKSVRIPRKAILEFLEAEAQSAC